MFETRKMLFGSWFEMIILLSLDLMHLSVGSPREKFVMKGEFIEIETMPHAAMLILGTKWPTDTSICCASVLNHRWVLTAAHCVADLHPRYGNVKMRFGIDHYSQEGPVMDVMRAVCRKRFYRFPDKPEDICLLQTFDEIPFSEKVQPVALPLANETVESVSTVRVAGWGQMSEMVPVEDFITKRLRAVDIPIIGLRECSKGADLTVDDDLFCAGDEASGKGLCYGDSGSSAVIRRSDNRTWVALGVVSSGYCLGPTAFVSVVYHASWIKRKMRQYS